MLFAGSVVGLAAALSWASDQASLPPHPLMLLPGMSNSHSFPASLPAPVISDLTNAPNPFDSRHAGLAGETQISYTLAGNYGVTMTLYDLLGQRVRSWDFQAGEEGGRAGNNSILWDGTNESGRKVSKGGYIAELQVDAPQTSVTAIRKIGVIH